MSRLGDAWNALRGKKKEEPPVKTGEQTRMTPVPSAMGWGAYGGGYARASRVVWKWFDGEKSAGGMGPINRYTLDHDALRMRSWQLLIESEIVQIGINRWVTWAVGKGLKLRAEPDEDVLASMGIGIDKQVFSKQMEGLWKLYAANNWCSWSNMVNLQKIMWEAEKNALLGGDVLWIINIENGMPKIDLKDGAHVRSPLFSGVGTSMGMRNPETGNRVRHGIEFNDRGEHVAYYVYRGSGLYASPADALKYERIPARDQFGNVRAFMYYGIRYRLDDIRGIPLIAVCMETTKQLEMYKEATVEGAVERAKIAFSIEHELGSVGTNPLESNLARGFGLPTTQQGSDIPVDIAGQKLADTFAATTGRQAINLPPGAKVNATTPAQEAAFKDFYEPNMAIIFAALNIPIEVALMKFGSNYSASRAAIKDWEHTLEVQRESRIQGPYQTVYSVFMLCGVLMNRVQAPGFLEAFRRNDVWVLAAYTNAKWIGDRVPNIDEKKEVDATRALLGADSVNVPLITVEDAMERHSSNDFRNAIEQYEEEMEYCEEHGIERAESGERGAESDDESGEDKSGKGSGEREEGDDEQGE
ncbi:MAG: phage portal protein [Taibaiella sp.]|nr:phage portal protein [Taibaiella sp.]